MEGKQSESTGETTGETTSETTGETPGKTTGKTTTPWSGDMPTTSIRKAYKRPYQSIEEEPSTSLQDRAFDYLIENLADAISSESSLKRLGLELGLKKTDIELALETNRIRGKVTSEGRRGMLQNWKESVEPSERIPTLRAALKKADLGELEEKYLLREFHTETIDPVRNELMKERNLHLNDDNFVKYFFILEILGKDAMRKGSLVGEESGIEKSITISATSSSHLAAVGLFTLLNLKYLNIWAVELGDDFYKGMCAAASQSKIETFIHHIYGMDSLGPDASLHYARALFSMPNLKSLGLTGLELSDEFYSTMATEASHSKIEEFAHHMEDMAPLGPDASLHYARALFSMPNLESLLLHGPNVSDDFYSTMATEASHSKIETFRFDMEDMAPLGPDASLYYARGLLSMPNLKTLGLYQPNLSDEFYSTMATGASNSKIERFTHNMYPMAALGPDASLHYARGLFSMPNLKSLQLFDPQLSDEFYSTMATEASNSKIQSLDMTKVSMTQRILHAILSLKHLQSLKMSQIDFVDKHDEEMLTHKTSTVDELSLDGRDVTSLWKLGLHTSCPQLQKLCLHWHYKENVSSDIVTKACSPFHHLTHLHINGDGGTVDPESLSSAIITSCPHLSQLSISYVKLHNDSATKIIQSMKTHQHLTSLELVWCQTDEHLDPLIAEVNSEGKLNVTVTHDQGWQREERPSATKKSTPTRQESSSDLEGKARVQVHEEEKKEEEEGGEGEEEEDDEEEQEQEEGEEKEEEKEEQKEKEEGEEEVKEDQNSMTEKFLYEGVSSEGKATPIEMECCKSVGVEGGKLQLKSFGIELEIPPGAIDSETPQDIALRVLTVTANLGNSKDEMSVCFGVQCVASDDLDLKLPVIYTIPHCAVMSRYSSAEAVLYTGEGEYTPDAAIKERIVLPRSGIPSCTVMKDALKLQMNHFSWAKIKLRIKNFFFRGKRMCCLPFTDKNLPVQKAPVILRAHLYEDIPGNRKIVESLEKEQGFRSVHPEMQVLIKALEVDLSMTCYVKEKIIGGPAVVSFERLNSGDRICEPFTMDFSDQSDIVAVSLKAGQNKKLEVNLTFALKFPACHRTERDSSQTLRRSQRTRKKIPDSVKETEVAEAKLARLSDFDKLLKTVASRVVKDREIDDLGRALGFTPEDISRYIKTNHKGQEVTWDGTLQMLRDWRKKQTKVKECVALKAALEKAEQINLASKLFGKK